MIFVLEFDLFQHLQEKIVLTVDIAAHQVSHSPHPLS